MALWWPKLRPGGRLCGDDGAQPAVRQRLRAFLKTIPQHDVGTSHQAASAPARTTQGPSGLAGVAWFAHDHWCLTVTR